MVVALLYSDPCDLRLLMSMVVLVVDTDIRRDFWFSESDGG